MSHSEASNLPSRTVLLGNPAFRAYAGSRFATAFALETLDVGVGWQVYDLTRSPLMLGLVGLSAFLPSLVLVLVTGAAADRFPRRLIMRLALAVLVLCAATLFALTLLGNREVGWIFLVLTVIGLARAFYNPANRSLVNNVAPREHLATAISINSSGSRIGMISGSVAGGLLYGVSAELPFLAGAGFLVTALVLVGLLPAMPRSAMAAGTRLETMLAGAKYVMRNRLLLGAISLDLFAVLLSGATALLPVFARDILGAGPLGLGLLRSAPGLGAIAVALLLAWRPISHDAGRIMFLCVGGFGLVTAAFGLSHLMWLSVLLLALSGGFDMVSVLVRETLVQLATPDAMRGRVNAINGVFVSASNEIGEFRAGLMAAWIGAVPAVLVGGVGAVLVAGIWMRWFPELLNARRLDGRELPGDAPPEIELTRSPPLAD